MSDAVPPEAGSPFVAEISHATEWDGYWTREHAVAEAMARMGLSKPDAEALVDEHGPAVIEIIRGSW